MDKRVKIMWECRHWGSLWLPLPDELFIAAREGELPLSLTNGARHHVMLTTPDGLREMRQHQGTWPQMPFHGDSLQPSCVPAGEPVRLGYLTLIDEIDEWERNNSGAMDGKSG